MHARLHGLKNLLIRHQIKIEPNFPSLAYEIAETRPDMNIKAATFTVSEKSINMFACFDSLRPSQHDSVMLGRVYLG